MYFTMGFWLFRMCFINVLFKIITNLKFYKHCFNKTTIRSIFVS
jgi:hypothetical protein